MWYAVYMGHTDIAIALLRHRPVIDDNCGDANLTPLLVACGKGYATIVRLLIGAGADPTMEAVGLQYGTSMLCAAHNGHLEVVQILMENPHAAYLVDKVPRWAVSDPPATSFTRTPENFFAWKPKNMERAYGQTPLHAAVASSHADRYKIIEILCQKGADMNALMKNGRSPLGEAVNEAVAVGRLLEIDDVSDVDKTCCPPKKVVAFTHAFSFALKRHNGSCEFPPRATVIPSSPWASEKLDRV